jgi:hypothetical protein
MVDDIRIMTWTIKATAVATASATVNITDYLNWAKKEGLGEEMNDLSNDDFRRYMELNGPAKGVTAITHGTTIEWEDVEEAR